jgi:hypothetical protein
VDVASGKVELSMVSTAVLHIGRLLSFPPLHLDFCLTTDTAEGRRFRCWGTRTQKATGFSRCAAWKTTAGLCITNYKSVVSGAVLTKQCCWPAQAAG